MFECQRNKRSLKNLNLFFGYITYMFNEIRIEHLAGKSEGDLLKVVFQYQLKV